MDQLQTSCSKIHHGFLKRLLTLRSMNTMKPLAEQLTSALGRKTVFERNVLAEDYASDSETL